MPDKHCRLCKGKITGRGIYYCSAAHRRKWHSNQESSRSKKEKARVYDKKTKPRGRQCVHCLGFDDEILFLLTARCTACDRMFQRNGLCEDCGKIRSSKYGDSKVCHHCHPPFGAVKIIIIERRGRQNRKREKTIFRFIAAGSVTINGRQRVVQCLPFVLNLPTKEWLKVRR